MCWVVPEQGLRLCPCCSHVSASESQPLDIAGHLQSVGHVVLELPEQEPRGAKVRARQSLYVPWSPPSLAVLGIPAAGCPPWLGATTWMRLLCCGFSFFPQSSFCFLQPGRAFGPTGPSQCQVSPLLSTAPSLVLLGLSMSQLHVLPVALVSQEHLALHGSSSHCL